MKSGIVHDDDTFVTKLWNASKFAISHLEDLDLSVVPELLPIDRWIVERTNQTIMTATELFNEYEIGSARHEIDDFFNTNVAGEVTLK